MAVWKDRTSEMNDASAAPDALVGAGVEFAVDGDRRPTTAPLQQVLAAGADEVSADLAGRLRTTADWRTDYAPLLAELTGACAGDPAAAVAMARAGVDRARAELVWTDPAGERPLTALTETDWDVEAPGTEVITGRGEPETELVVPYRGERLRGAALHARLEAWTAAGIVEPSFAAAVGAVIDNPRWLALPGRTIAMVGAGGEMSPLAPLTRWGADVLAVDLPQARVQAHIRDLAEEGAGRVRLPRAGVGRGAGATGLDVTAQTARTAAWLTGELGDAEPVFGMYAYADRGAHVRISAATDLIIERLRARHPSTTLAYLQTPTDAFLVPPEIVEAGHRAWSGRGPLRLLQPPLRLAGRGRLFVPSYRDVHPDGTAVADILVPQQGPSYAVAKRLQRWRGVLAEADGATVSFNVAPASWTRSVTRNKVLAAAYRGARHFGVEIFDADTARVLMAAALVHDVMRGPVTRTHPEELFSDQAAHGGLWRGAYEPKTALGFAAVLGITRL